MEKPILAQDQVELNRKIKSYLNKNLRFTKTNLLLFGLLGCYLEQASGKSSSRRLMAEYYLNFYLRAVNGVVNVSPEYDESSGW